MRSIMLLVKNEGTTKSMMVEANTPRAKILRTLLQERRMDQSSLITRDLTPHEVKS